MVFKGRADFFASPVCDKPSFSLNSETNCANAFSCVILSFSPFCFFSFSPPTFLRIFALSLHARKNSLVVSPPKRYNALRVINVVNEVLILLARVWFTLALTISGKVAFFARNLQFSLILSKTTIVSWFEKPITVKTAVINNASICTSKNMPSIAKNPSTNNAS